MGEVFKEIPLSVKGPVGVGGVLLNILSPKLPDYLEPFAYVLGAGIALWVFVAFVWHFVNTRRESNGRPRLRVEPSYLIILGLFIAAIGVVWQMRLPATAAAPLEIQSQLSAARNELAELKASKPTEAPRTKLLFRIEQIRAFKEDFDSRAKSIRDLAKSVEGMFKLRVTQGHFTGSEVSLNRDQGMLARATYELQDACNKFFVEKVEVTPPNPTMQDLTTPMRDDAEIQDYDQKLQYRAMIWKNQHLDGSLLNISNKLDAETTTIKRQISELKE